MRYAGFWVRAGATLIDAIVFLPLMFLYFWTESHSRTGTLLIVIPYYLLDAAFCIFFLGKYGKTPGKMVMRIVVTRTDGSSIGYLEALKRHSVDAMFGLITGIGILIAVLHTEPSLYCLDMIWHERMRLITDKTPTFATVAGRLSIAWGYSELIVLLFNKKKRAIHDFIAGTVVVYASES